MKKKIFYSWLLVLAFSLFLPINAQAATSSKTALVDYWYQVMTVSNKVEVNKQEITDIKHLTKQLDQLIATCKKSQIELQAIKLNPLLTTSLMESHQQRIAAIDNIMEALEDVKDFSTTPNPLKIITFLDKIKIANEQVVESNEGLVKVCQQYLVPQNKLSSREALVAYWAATTEKELVLNQVMNKMLDTGTNILVLSAQKEDPQKIQQQVAGIIGDLEKTLAALSQDLKKVPLTGPLAQELQPIHSAKLEVIEQTIQLLRLINQSWQTKDSKELAKVTGEVSADSCR